MTALPLALPLPMQKEPPATPTVLVDWKETLMPESREPTLPRRVIFSAVASDRSSRELLMAERRSTTPFDAVAEELRMGFNAVVCVCRWSRCH